MPEHELARVKKIASILVRLVEQAKQGEREDLLITYADLSRTMNVESSGEFVIEPINLNHYLGPLADFCKEQGVPILTTIVVNQGSLLPGDGYFKYLFSGTPRDRWEEVFMEQYNAVMEYSGWNELLQKLNELNMLP